MPLELKKIDVSVESRIVGNLVMSTSLLSKVRQYADPKLMESSLSRIVCGWVFDFYDSVGTAPELAIRDVFERRKRELEPADAEMVEVYLKNASDEWRPTNEQYMEDTCLKYFQERSAVKLADDIAAAKEAGDIRRVDELVAAYCKPEMSTTKAIDLLDDTATIADAFNDDEDIVLTLPGAYGDCVGSLTTDDFVAIGAPPKRGKSWGLMDMCFRSVLQGSVTLFISLEMSKKQVIRRLWQMFTGRGRRNCIRPISYFEDTDDGRSVMYTDNYQVQRVDTDPKKIAAMQAKFKKLVNGGKLKILCFNTKSLSVAMLRQEIEKLKAFYGFVPRVICVDYPDIMKPGPSKEKRIQLDDIWSELRGIGLEYHALMLGATQMGRDTVTGAKDCSEKDITECIGKLGHITKLIVLNQNEEDGKAGVIRAKCTTTRDGDKVFDEAVISECLEIGRFYMDSRLLSKLNMNREDEYGCDRR